MELSATSMESPPHAGNEAENNNLFQRFDVVSDPSDHTFVNSTPTCHEAYKAIMQEWKFLEKNLPELIFVRVYEDRIDLLRAVIVGASGTPYYNGLFFFDFLFPSNYPSLPPKVHYRSYGLGLNPNLYSNGHVCLSLLNTWNGKKCEKWNPSKSSVFQILLSIQALVLNEKPYFNEPMRASRLATVLDKKSQAYSEEVFALSCRTMLYLNLNPPKNFEIFISRHFCRRGLSILMACEAYVNGQVPVGYFGESPSIIKVSAKFRAEMMQLYPKLVDAFRRNGASIDTSIERLTVKKTQSPTRSVAGAKKDSIAKKVITKVRKMLGFKKKKTGQKIKATGNEAD